MACHKAPSCQEVSHFEEPCTHSQRPEGFSSSAVQAPCTSSQIGSIILETSRVGWADALAPVQQGPVSRRPLPQPLSPHATLHRWLASRKAMQVRQTFKCLNRRCFLRSISQGRSPRYVCASGSPIPNPRIQSAAQAAQPMC